MPPTDRVLTFEEWWQAIVDDPDRQLAEIEQLMLPLLGLAPDISVNMLVKHAWLALYNKDYQVLEQQLDQLTRLLAQKKG